MKDYAFTLTRTKKRTNWERRFYVIAFILGMVVYLYIPIDHLPTAIANAAPIPKAVYFDEAGHNCVIFNTNPAQEAICK